MSALVTEGRRPSAPAGLARGAGLAAVLLLVGVFPGRRPEEQDRITRFAYVAGEWAAGATMRVCPRQLRVAWRLMLPALYVAAHHAAIAGTILTTTAFFLTWGRVSPASPPGAIERVLATSGGVLALLLALAHVALANGLGMSASDYLRYATLPLPTEQLLRRMLLVAAVGGALVDALVAITWGLIVQRDVAVAIQFSAGVVCLLVTALCAYIGLAAGCWSYWLRFASVFARAWGIVPAAILIWQFHVFRSRPLMLLSLAAIEAAAAIIAGAAAWVAIGRMVTAREPAA